MDGVRGTHRGYRREREGEVYTTMEYLDPPLLVHPPRHSPLSHDLCAVVAVSTGYWLKYTDTGARMRVHTVCTGTRRGNSGGGGNLCTTTERWTRTSLSLVVNRPGAVSIVVSPWSRKTNEASFRLWLASRCLSTLAISLLIVNIRRYIFRLINHLLFRSSSRNSIRITSFNARHWPLDIGYVPFPCKLINEYFLWEFDKEKLLTRVSSTRFHSRETYP